MADTSVLHTVAFNANNESRVMFGCAPTGGIFQKEIQRKDAIGVLHHAVLHYHIRAIDTAPWYGCGKSELDLKEAVESLPEDARNDLSIFTKTGRVTLERSLIDDEVALEETAERLGLKTEVLYRRMRMAMERDTGYVIHSETANSVCVEVCTPQGLKESWSSSKQRLGETASALVKSVRLHDADTKELMDEVCSSGGLQTLSTVFHGAQPSLGLNDASVALEYIFRADALDVPQPRKYFQTIMIAGCWNLLDQSALELLLQCQARGVNVHLGGVFASGYLWGGAFYRYERPTGAAAADLQHRRQLWTDLAAAYQTTLPALSLQFALLPACVQYAAVGCATVQELDACMHTMSLFVSSEKLRSLLREARDQNLISQRVFDALC